MPRALELEQWRTEIAKHFPHLSQPMVMRLALWSLGMILVRSGRLTAITDWWSCRLGQPFHTVRERLRDTHREAEGKAGGASGRARPECLLGAVARLGLGRVVRHPTGRGFGGAPLGQRFVLLVIRVVYRGCAVPLIWKVLPAGCKHPWKPEWLALLQVLRGRVSPTWTVIVLADRGLYAKWLFEALIQRGWHPMLRVNGGGSFRPEGGYHWVPFRQLVLAVDDRWPGSGTAFTHPKARLNCTLLGCWEAGHDASWLI